MIRIIIHGCGGKMGRTVAEIAENDSACKIVAGIDPGMPKLGFPVFATPEECSIDGDVIIDFSTAAAVPALLEHAKRKGIPAVVCTTAISDETMAQLKETANSIAILRSANMSLGINLVLDLVQRAASILADANFDIEIIEKHHNQKIDAPSGTAIAIADAVNTALEQQYHYVYDRSQLHEKRDPKEIGIHAVRGGNIVGDHDVIFAGRDEVIEISHKAASRQVFAVGALKAAKFLASKEPGLYSMKDVLK